MADLLAKDPALRRLAAEHGFRPVGDPGLFAEVVEERATGRVQVALPGPRVSPPPVGLWREFTTRVVDDVPVAAGQHGSDCPGCPGQAATGSDRDLQDQSKLRCLLAGDAAAAG